MSMPKMTYQTCCVEIPLSQVDDLRAMIDSAQDISLATFTRLADWKPWARDQGYAVGAERGLHLARDWHVGYRRSTWRGRPCVFAVHSAIEHIFTAPAQDDESGGE